MVGTMIPFINELMRPASTTSHFSLCPWCLSWPCKCRTVSSASPPLLTGWRCPVCGRVYSPFVRECLNCNQHGSEPSVG
jgi:hypothetical protein